MLQTSNANTFTTLKSESSWFSSKWFWRFKILLKKINSILSNNAQKQLGFLGGCGRQNQILSVNLSRRLWVLENELLLWHIFTWFLIYPERGHRVGTLLNRNSFPPATQELPKRCALTTCKVARSNSQNLRRGRKVSLKKYRKVHPELRKGNIASGSNFQMFLSTLWDPMDYSTPDFSVYGIFQARILQWVAISFSRGSSRPRDQTQFSWRQTLYCLSHQGIPSTNRTTRTVWS